MNELQKVVFDCNVFLQALARPDGPAGRCVDLALAGKVQLYISPQVLEEIQDVTSRPKLIAKFRLREDRVADFLEKLPKTAIVVTKILNSWKYDRDPDDAHYVNLAIAVGARLIVSRDKDLLDLMSSSNQAGRELLAQHPGLAILTPPEFLAVVDLNIT